jgi:phosphate starvation-inducible PhoH-like protein
VTIFRRGEKFIVSGENAERAVQIPEKFYDAADKSIPVEEVQLALVEQRTSAAPAKTAKRRKNRRSTTRTSAARS